MRTHNLTLISVIATFGALAISAPSVAKKAAQPVDRAIQLRLDAIASDPDEPRNHFNLGLEYYNRDQYDLASKAFQKAIKVGKKNKEAHAAVDMDCHQILGDIHMRQEKYKVAADWFARGLKINPRDHVCAFGRGQAFFFGRNYKSAKKAFEAYLNIATSSGDPKVAKEAPTALTYLGAMAMEKKKFDEAADFFRRVMTEYPKQSKEASVNLAIVLLTKGDKVRKNKLPEAVALYDEAVSADPDNSSALRASALGHYELGLSYAALKKAPDSEKAKKTSHFRMAERNFLRASEQDEKDFQSRYYAGLSQFQLEKYSEMIKSYEQSVAINPDQAGARYNLALALYNQQLYQDALAQAEQAKRLAPKDADTNALLNNIFDAYKTDCMTRGAEAISADRFTEAIGWWKRALELDPHNPEAPEFIEQAKLRMAELIEEHTKKGDAAFASRDLLTASNEWNAAFRLDPDSDELKAKLAKVSKSEQVQAILKHAEKSYAAKDYQAAMAKVTEALQIQPKNRSAIALRKKISQRQSSGVSALVKSAMRYISSGKLLRAKRKLLEARDADPENKTVARELLKVNNLVEKKIGEHELAAATAMKAGDKASAQKSYEAILELNPKHVEAAKAIRNLTGKESRTTVDAAKVKKLNKQGIFAYMRNDLPAAEKAWREALALDKDNTEIKRSLERVRTKMGKTGSGKRG